MKRIIRKTNVRDTREERVQLLICDPSARMILGGHNDVEAMDIVIRFGRVGDPLPFVIRDLCNGSAVLEWKIESLDLMCKRMERSRRGR